MAVFNDLPLEVLPGIVQNVARPSSLASFCLVNRVFCKFTQPFLYHTIAILPWHPKEKILKAFCTLSSSPELAKHVRKLEIRDFPDKLGDLLSYQIVDSCLPGLANAVNLRCFIWTQGESLTANILLTISKHPSLQELEFGGLELESYNRGVLPRFISPRLIRLITPSPGVVAVLPEWLKSLVDPLRNLSLVYKSSTAVTDVLIEKISEDLSDLDELHLAGCQRVTHQGLLSALRHNKNGIKSLCIENLSPSLDLRVFCQQCQKAQLLNHMTSLTISINYALLRSAWMKDIPELVSSSPLEYFHLYSTPLAEDLKGIELDDFVTALISTHGLRLRRLSIHRLPISLKTLHNACVGFTNLEQLFTVVRGEDLESTGNSLSKATKLQAVHINFLTLLRHRKAFSCVSAEDALQIVRQCSPTITQIGSAGHVWKVVREVTQEGEEKTVMVKMIRDDRPEVPDQFRVSHV